MFVCQCFSSTSAQACPVALTEQLHMDDQFSTTTIPGTSPVHEPASQSILDLSREFKRYSLQPSRQNLFDDRPPSRVSSFYLPMHSNRNPTSFNSSQAVFQRQSMARRQCNPAHLLKIHSLVEGLASDGRPRSKYSGSTTTTSESPLEDTLPDLPSYTHRDPTCSAPSSENEESDSGVGYKRVYPQNKPSKDLRHSLPEGMGKKNDVLKRIRYRKSFLKRRSMESGKRQDRQRKSV